jgi:hypothetical protein
MELGNKGYMKEVAQNATKRVIQCKNNLKKWRKKNAKK